MAQQASPTQADTDAPAPGRQAPAELPPLDNPEGTIEVTGSRLYDGDVTSKKIVIDRAEIQRLGVSSVEDLIRTLPQNVATIGGVLNERTRGPLGTNRPRGSEVSALGSLGVSAANLGGIGAGNTLVLINGRRLAGAAGIEDGFVNLNGIPLSAIERVEIIPSGGGAVYGADAMSGVINFILRKDYRGITIGGQAEFSNNGADTRRVNGYAGFSWGSGQISGTADYSRANPVVNAKTGYVTNNYADRFNGDPFFDQRSFQNGSQPGLIDNTIFDFDPVTFETIVIRQALTVRPGLTRPPTRADLITVGPEALRDFVPKLAGPHLDMLSFTLNIDQKITDRLKFFANGIYSRARNRQQVEVDSGLGFQLAPGQAYNPFAAFEFDTWSPGVTVYYYPQDEAARGDIVPGELRGTSKQWSVNAGLTYDFNDNTHLTVIHTRSRSSAKASDTRVNSLISIQPDSSDPRGFRCSYFPLESGQLQGAELARVKAIFDRQCLALTSSDPAVAFNPFRSSAQGAGASISAFQYALSTEDRGSTLSSYEARLTGNLVSFPAGSVSYAVGGEYSDDGINSREINFVSGAVGSRSRYAFFGEVSLPILGDGYDLPFARSLTFNLAARRDTSRLDGPIGTVDGVPLDLGGELIFGRNEFTRWTPSFGVRYQPFDTLTFLAKWGRGFKAPPATQLFSPSGTQTFGRVVFDDPLYTCTTDCRVPGDPRSGYTVQQVNTPNPDLRPETSRQESFNASWTPRGALDGLRLEATFNRTRIRNQYARPDDLSKILTSAQFFSLPQNFPRGPNGKITQWRNIVTNLQGSEFQSMTYEASYSFMTSFGNFAPRLIVVDNLKAVRRTLPGALDIDTLGKIQGPDNYRLVGSLTYDRDKLSVTLWGYHTPKYTNDYLVDFRTGRILDQDGEFARSFTVGSYTTFDLTGSWNARNHLRVNAAVRNLFDAQPPFTVVEGRPYDAGRYNIAGRTAMLQLEYIF